MAKQLLTLDSTSKRPLKSNNKAFLLRTLKKNVEKGFTLIESLVTLLLLSIALFTLIKTQTNSASHLNRMEMRALASIVSNNLAVQSRLLESPNKGFSNGEYQLAEQTWFWESQVEDTPNHKVLKITIKVFANKNHEREIFTQEFFQLKNKRQLQTNDES